MASLKPEWRRAEVSSPASEPVLTTEERRSASASWVLQWSRCRRLREAGSSSAVPERREAVQMKPVSFRRWQAMMEPGLLLQAVFRSFSSEM